MARKLFCTVPDVFSIQDEFVDLRNDSPAGDLFKVKLVTQIWCIMHHSYFSMIALRVLVPFASSYMCEARFSNHVNYKIEE